ncbi:MAG: adenylosuccinate synthetase [Burkholderiaceae bacterium]|nr:adenylosuccinate synthetase [Burkholderiaceae bacterium]
MKNAGGYADVLVGLQYGDEGKAKVVDFLANEYDIIARFNGGANAGHTVVSAQGAVKLRQIPSAVFYPDKLLYIGSGCAVGIVQLAEEIRSLQEIGISLKGRLYVSSRCVLVQPVHMHLDQIHGKEIGTTGNGIGPCYADRALRMQDGERVALQIRDLLDDSASALALMHKRYLAQLGTMHGAETQVGVSMQAWSEAWQLVQSYVTDDPLFLVNRVQAGACVLFEGAQSVLLDVMYGDQPYVTSSHTAPSYAYVGGDLPCAYHRKSIGVAKAVMSRVGSGHFPSELGGARSEQYCAEAARNGTGAASERASFDAAELLRSNDAYKQGIALRMLTGEYGTGSGRPRRVGLLDLAQLADVVTLHGIDELFLNKCDCLVYFSDTPQACIPLLAGRGKDRGTVNFPAFTLDGEGIPFELQQILEFIEAQTGCRIRGIGIGPERHQSVYFNETLIGA